MVPRKGVCFITALRPGTVIKDEAIPALLRQSRRSIFVTINQRDFWRRIAADPRYRVVCLVPSDPRAWMAPDLLRRLLRLRQLRTSALRSGMVLRASPAKVAGTILIGVASSCVTTTGHVCDGDSWGYAFADRSQGRDDRYLWEVFSDGHVAFFGPTPPVGVASGIDIEGLLMVNSDRAVVLAAGLGGDLYLAAHPRASIELVYRYFASRIQCHLHYYDISPGRDGCEIVIDIDGGSGALLDRDLSCLGS